MNSAKYIAKARQQGLTAGIQTARQLSDQADTQAGVAAVEQRLRAYRQRVKFNFLRTKRDDQ